MSTKALDTRLQALRQEAMALWRESYGQHLAEDECDELTRRLLTLFGLQLPTPEAPQHEISLM
jgi:hypothetical protein